MGWYVVRRTLAAIPVLIVVATIVFTVVHLIPGDPAAVMLGPSATPAEIDHLRQQLGINRPLYLQLTAYYGRLLRGDLGQTIFTAEPVTRAIVTHIPPTLYLTAFASLIAVALGVGTGALSAINPGGRLDQFMMLLAVGGVSIPDFLWGLLLILLFAISFRWLPVAGYVSPGMGLELFLRYMILPAYALGVTQAALIARITRASMVEVKQADYIRTARAKGLSQRVVLLRHVLRAALIPTITVIGLSFAVLLGGAVVIETIFTIPGLGQLLINSVLRRDYPVIEGAVLFMAVVYIAMNVAVDIAYGLVDPRIKYS